MKNLLKIYFFFLLCSCNKERSIHISAKNPVTGKPYSGLTYYLLEEKDGYSGEKITTIATGQLDANGEVIAKVKIKKDRSYRVEVDPPIDHCYRKDYSFSYTIHDENKNPNFEFQFAECSNLKLKIQNLNCQSENDFMHFRSRQSYTEWQSFSNNRMGCYDYESIDHFQVPEGWRIYNWVVYRDGIKTEFTDSIFLSAGEYKTFTMNY